MEFSVDTKSLAYGHRIQALSSFREAERLEPADYRTHLQLGAIYSSLGQECQASEEYRRAVRLRLELRNESVRAVASRETLWSDDPGK